MCDSLRAVTFSEFDNHMGTQLRHQYPPETLSQEDFEALSEYVIVPKQLAKRVIVVKRKGYQFANYSVAIENAKYHRNTLFFSLGVVVEGDADIKPFEVVLRKMSSMLVALEEEGEYLFKAHESDNLRNLVCAVFNQLRASGRAFLQINKANVLCLQLYETPSEPPVVHDWQVPTLLFHRALISELPWESTLHHLIPRIDGWRTVKQVSVEAAIDVELVKKAIRVLLWYGIAFMTDVTKFSNRYQAASRIDMVNTNAGMDEISRLLHGDTSGGRSKAEVDLKFDGRNGVEKKTAITRAESETLRSILFALHPGLTIRDLCLHCLSHNLDISRIDIARLLAIAVHLGVIQRIYDYPVSEYALDNQHSLRFLQKDGTTDLNALGSRAFSVGMNLNEYMNQFPSFQDFSLAHSSSPAALDVESDPQETIHSNYKHDPEHDDYSDHDSFDAPNHGAEDCTPRSILRIADGVRHLDDLSCELRLGVNALKNLPTFVYIRK